MKVVIVAGGLGTRISELSVVMPKPMVEVGGYPILWHIMKIYSHYGLNDFIICLGYKGYMIKEYFANYFLHQSDVTFKIKDNKMRIHKSLCEPWSVTLVDTGADVQTGGRLKRIWNYIIDDDMFCFTYGDGLCNVNISDLIAFHIKNKKKSTVTAVQIPGRYGSLKIDNKKNVVSSFIEKPIGDGSWINGGFFVLDSSILDYIDGDSTVWEEHPLKQLAKEGQLSAFKHYGFWLGMDTVKDKNKLDELWASKKAPWRVWND